MSEFIEWVPKHHGHQPLHWKPDMLTSVDGKNFVSQPNWAWIAGSVYYVPPEAVGMVREVVEPEPDPLAEVLEAIGGDDAGYCDYNTYAALVRAGLEARGLEIRVKNDD